jgi:hypothetical protein
MITANSTRLHRAYLDKTAIPPPVVRCVQRHRLPRWRVVLRALDPIRAIRLAALRTQLRWTEEDLALYVPQPSTSPDWIVRALEQADRLRNEITALETE